jgi:hypothetical protein
MTVETAARTYAGSEVGVLRRVEYAVADERFCCAAPVTTHPLHTANQALADVGGAVQRRRRDDSLTIGPRLC